jgi:HD-like signal output (HDOD) protein
MRLANSAVYGGLHEVTELSAACSRLGMRTIANTVQAVANKNLYITGDKTLRAHMERLWRHAVATAYCAESLAGILAEPNTESLFLAGLLHDVGKVALLDMVSGGYSGPLGELRNAPELLREVLDGFHMLVGLHVAQHWELPPALRVLIYFHNVPSLCHDEDMAAGAHIVCLADVIANIEGFGLYEPRETVYLTSHESTRHLNLSDVKLATLRVDLADRLEAVIEAVSVPAGAV